MREEIEYAFWFVAFIFLAALSLMGACVVMQGCSPSLTPAQQTDVEHHGTVLSVCRDQAREARAADASAADSYALYEACKKDGGIQ